MAAPIPKVEFQRVASGCGTISEKARALSDAGYSISQIAATLERSYQQIRQIVKEHERRKAKEYSLGRELGRPDNAPGGFAEAAGEAYAGSPVLEGAARLVAYADGTVVIPAALLNAAGIRPGDVMVATAEDGQIVVRSAERAMQHAQDLVQRWISSDDSLSDSLIADRRREAAEEDAVG